MKALSIKQPWASLIAHGIKDIENRSWKTNFRGRVFIHASAKMAVFFTGKNLAFTPDQWKIIPKEFSFQENRDNVFLASAIIGEVDIVDCVTHHPSVWSEVQIGEGKPIYNWVLANAKLYDKPILNVKGKLSFWEPDIDIVECIGCSEKFNSEEMEEDDANEKYCSDCWEVFLPIFKKEAKENGYETE